MPSTPRLQQSGLSLVELMVAIAIGAFLILGLAQIFGSTKASFISAEALSRVQENGRFALEFLRRDSRMVGHMGCINDISHSLSNPPTYINHNVAVVAPQPAAFGLRFERPVEGFEANGTAPASNLTLGSATPSPGAISAWTPNLPSAAPAVDLANEVLPGSDVLVLRFAGEEFVPLASPFTDHANQRVTIDTTAIPTGFTVESGGIYAVADCDHVSFFQATSALAAGTFNAANEGGSIANGDNQRVWTDNQFGTGSLLYRGESLIYYVGRNATTNLPVLVRRRMGVTAGNASYQREELVEGVENMQVLYGVDTTQIRDDQVDAYLTAGQVASTDPDGAGPGAAPAWGRVVSVRISLLVRSPEQSNATNFDARDVGGVNVTPPSDGRLRQVYETTIAMRNRLRGA